jgi:hypothetical protein
MPEDQRQDFSLYVDEFQNFATESFATILSEARKYRLSLILANQFMTQLTDQIREAILGNIGTVISGRIGITDAEILIKKFTPTFDVEDLTRMPNFQTIASVMVQDVPSAAFSMSLLPPLGQPNPQLRDALKNLSATKFGKPRAQVEQEFFKRMSIGDEVKRQKAEALKKAQEQRMAAFRAGTPAGMNPGAPAGAMGPGQPGMPPQAGASTGMAAPQAAPQPPSFLDEWLSKRQQIMAQQKTAAPQANPAFGPTARLDARPQAQSTPVPAGTAPKAAQQQPKRQAPVQPQPAAPAAPEELHIRSGSDDDSVSIKLR